MKQTRGFTLLEVLVALAIFALVAAVVLTAAGRSVANAGRLEALTLAGWIADNRLTELQLLRPPPGIGREERELTYAGRQWQTLSSVEASGTPGLLRVSVWVAPAATPGERGPIAQRALTRLSGCIGTPP